MQEPNFPVFNKKISNTELELKREQVETLTLEQLRTRIAVLQLRIDKLRAIEAEFLAS